MANIFRGQGSTIGRLLALLLTLLCTAMTNAGAMAQLYDQPVLVVDPGMHTADIDSVDAAGRFGVTGSEDKTVRLWSLTDGKLLQTIRMPAGPDRIGEIYAVAMSPDGALVAAGGYTRWSDTAPEEQLYLFDAGTGEMVRRIEGLSEVTRSLAFSRDGRYLAAGLGGGQASSPQGLRVYDRDQRWSLAFSDKDYGNDIYGIAFAVDGRLATASYDGNIRLYERNDRNDLKFKLVARKMTGGKKPFTIAFTRDGSTLAVGYYDTTSVVLLDGHSLAPRSPLNVNDHFPLVTWSREGNTLYAGGPGQILAWPNSGRGQRRALPLGAGNISALAASPDGGLLVGALYPVLLELLEPDGRPPRWKHPSPKADFLDQQDILSVSTDGAIIDFGFEPQGKSPLRFDVRELKLVSEPPADLQTSRASHKGLAVEHWRDESSPTLDGKPIKLDPGELSQSMAIHPDGRRFVLGTFFSLQAIDAENKQIWWRAAPGEVRAVNISGDGRLVVAAYGDGTIRWHRMADGRELLALFVLADKQNWVAWTPEGFYDATPDARGALRWQVNKQFDAAAVTKPVNEIPEMHRPDALKRVLEEMGIARALRTADLQAARRAVQEATGSAKPPGARLHVLTIGISDYGDKASDLKLKFADRDAEDIEAALFKQKGRYPYTEDGFIHHLVNKEADSVSILGQLEAMGRAMASGGGGRQDDVAVVMFSGHGMRISDQSGDHFYLVPYGADNSNYPTSIEATSIPATLIQQKILALTKYGKVLVLLDACRSEMLIGLPADKSELLARNVTVLTSSTADQDSREDPNWEHGAFTQVLLDALSGSSDVDTDGDGFISMEELVTYVRKHLDDLTAGAQKPGLSQQYFGNIFSARL
jgi:glucose/arabinose dehydrogenase